MENEKNNVGNNGKYFKKYLVFIVLSLTVLVFLLLFKKVIWDAINSKETNLNEEMEKKIIQERVELIKKGYGDSVYGEIVGISEDKKSLKIKLGDSEPVENKIFDVAIDSKTEIAKSIEIINPGKNKNETPNIEEKFEKMEVDFLQEGMVIQAQSDELFDLNEVKSFTAVKITFFENDQS